MGQGVLHTLEQEGVNNLKHVAQHRELGGMFFHESMKGRGRGFGGPASHARTFPDLVTPPGFSDEEVMFHFIYQYTFLEYHITLKCESPSQFMMI